MGHSRAEKEQSRERILEVAARMIREVGPNGIGIADLMKSANLTHGGFYGHFPSRDDLILAAIERAIDDGSKSFTSLPDGDEPGSVKSIANRYLSTPHRDNIARGCAVAALAADVGRMDDGEGRRVLGAHVEALFGKMTEAMGGGDDAKVAAVATWCTMVGAVLLSRVFGGSNRADEILELARQTVLDIATAVDQGEARPPKEVRHPQARQATKRRAGRPAPEGRDIQDGEGRSE